MSTPSDSPTEPAADRSPGESWWPPLPVIVACLLGCLLPAYAYAEAFAALRGFGIVSRRWAAVLLIVPTLVWVLEFRLPAILYLAPQLLVAAVVSWFIARVRGRRVAG